MVPSPLREARLRRFVIVDDVARTDKCNGWWCDVAADGCLRPCDSDNYAPAVRFAKGGGYVACEECFDSHLSQPEQRRGFIRVEPVSPRVPVS